MLQCIAHEAERIAPCPLAMPAHCAGDETVRLIEPVALAPHASRHLYQARKALRPREGLPPRFLVVSGTEPACPPQETTGGGGAVGAEGPA